MSRIEMMEFASDIFKEQMRLNLSDILTMQNDRFSISSDNKMGLSMASLRLDMTDEEHVTMAEFLTAVGADVEAHQPLTHCG